MALRRYAWTVVAAAPFAAALSGCAEPEADSIVPTPVSMAQTAIPPLEVVVAAPEAKGPVAETPPPAAEPPAPPEPPTIAPEHVEATEPKVAAYEPPFPERVDLFVAPKRDAAAATPGTTDNAVELMGFVRVGALKAVLAINGEVTPMAVGESRLGVKIISITPPNIVLQRGRQRWQATLE